MAQVINLPRNPNYNAIALQNFADMIQNEQQKELERRIANATLSSANPQEAIANIQAVLQPTQRKGLGGFVDRLFGTGAAVPDTRRGTIIGDLAKEQLGIERRYYGDREPWYWPYMSQQQRQSTVAGISQRGMGKTATQEDMIKYWQNVMSKAAGDYFYEGGLEGGAAETKDPAMYEYARKKLEELGVPFGQPTTQRTTDNEQQVTSDKQQATQPAFLDEVDKSLAEAYRIYDEKMKSAGIEQASTMPQPPADYPDAVWNDEHKMWTIIRNGRILGVK